jgi:hypothetical protein
MTFPEGRRLLHAGATASRWLWDADDPIHMERRRSPRTGGGADLRASLVTWARRIRRRRALTVARRQLIVWLAVAIAAEAAVVLSGHGGSPLWLLGPLALGLIAGAIALARPIPLASAAHAVDRSLDLKDLVVTGLELSQADAAPVGLPGLVLAEARPAAASSLGTLRLKTWSTRESAWLLAGVVALAALATVSGSGAAHSRSAAARGSSVTPVPGSVKQHGSSRPAARPRSRPSSLTPPTQSPFALAQSQAHRAGANTGPSPYGHGATALPSQQLARNGLASPPIATKALAAAETGGAGGAPSTGGVGSAAAGGSAASGAGASRGAATGATKTTTSPPGAATAGRGGALAPAGSRSGAGAGTSGASAGAGHTTGAAPPGGENAGGTRGTSALANGLVPTLAAGNDGLPLQAGYAPGTGKRTPGGEGVSQTANGGGSGGRSASASASGAGTAGSGLATVPPTSNYTPALDQAVLSSYFGLANQLTLSGW